VESIWSLCRLQLDDPENIHLVVFKVDSTWTEWGPSGLWQSPGGVQLECVGECKVHEDAATQREELLIPHGGLDKDRFKQAVQARNSCMCLYNQPEIRHYCKKCMHFLSHSENFCSFFLAQNNSLVRLQGFSCCN